MSWLGLLVRALLGIRREERKTTSILVPVGTGGMYERIPVTPHREYRK